MKFFVKFSGKKYPFKSFDEAMNFCFEMGIDPDKCLYRK